MKLKSCPFCGYPAVIETESILYKVYCSNCGASARMSLHLDKAIKAWNMRVSEGSDAG